MVDIDLADKSQGDIDGLERRRKKMLERSKHVYGHVTSCKISKVLRDMGYIKLHAAELRDMTPDEIAKAVEEDSSKQDKIVAILNKIASPYKYGTVPLEVAYKKLVEEEQKPKDVFPPSTNKPRGMRKTKRQQ